MADVHMSDGDVTMGDANELERLVCTAKTWPTKAFDLFRTLLQNVVSNPDDAKFRKLKLSNARISALLAETGALEGFQTLGWVMSGDALELPSKDLGNLDFVLKATDCGPPGDLVSLTVLRGALKSKIELPSNTLFSALASKIEESDALGRIPRKRQRLLIGVPPKPLEQAFPLFASMTISELGLKAFKLEDAWEEMVADLRALRASFESLASVLSCKKTLQDNFDFLLDSAKALLKSRAMKMDEAELRMARKCFAILWPPGVEETRLARIEHSAACTPLAVPQKSEDGTPSVPSAQQFPLQVERADLFKSAVSQIQKASIEELRRPLQVSFVGEAAEDAGGPRREFFNDFGRSCAEQDLWQTTPAGSLTPAGGRSDSNIFRSCGRIYGLSLCQAENAAQEQRVRENATIQELLAAVTGDDEPQAQQQKLLVGASLARPFLRCVQLDPPESLEELQAELNAENDESSPDFRGSTRFLTSSLAELGLEGQLTFSRERPDGTVVELKPAGNSQIVTDATKLEWLKSTLRSELVESVEEAARHFRLGVCEAAGAAYVVLLSAVELQQGASLAFACDSSLSLTRNQADQAVAQGLKEWSGMPEIGDADLKFWQERSAINPARKQQAAWFFEALWSPDWRKLRPKVLKFTTGSDRWPREPKGFTFYVEPMDGGDELLPRAMTCGNMLQLPSYSSKEQLQHQLLKACDLGLSMQLV